MIQKIITSIQLLSIFLLFFAIACAHPTLAKTKITTSALLYNGWYIQKHDDGNGQLTARLYGEYVTGSTNDKGANIASYRCERNQPPFLRIVLPDDTLELIRKIKKSKNFYFTDFVWLKSHHRNFKLIGWYSSQVRGLTINFYGDNIQLSQSMKFALLSAMSQNFRIIFPFNEAEYIDFIYAQQTYSNAEIADLGRVFGRKFLIQKQLEFLSECDILSGIKFF